MKKAKYNIPSEKIRSYDLKDSIIFKKNNERYGELSNMSMKFPLNVNYTTILNTEALYQACRFPHLVDLQKRIIDERSPMTVKMISNANKKKSREDWDEVKLKVMKWCLHLKLAQNFITFGHILDSTNNFHIVENSNKDNFWGAIPNETQTVFTGQNALGRLLMQLREEYRSVNKYSLLVVSAPDIDNFKLSGKQITDIDCRNKFINDLNTYYENQRMRLFK